jgi:hypothetical protein
MPCNCLRHLRHGASTAKARHTHKNELIKTTACKERRRRSHSPHKQLRCISPKSCHKNDQNAILHCTLILMSKLVVKVGRPCYSCCRENGGAVINPDAASRRGAATSRASAMSRGTATCRATANGRGAVARRRCGNCSSYRCRVIAHTPRTCTRDI